MKFAKWLYHLTATDQFIIVGFFLFGIGLSYLTIISFRYWHNKIHHQAEYSHEVRITPFFLTCRRADLCRNTIYVYWGKRNKVDP